MPMDSETRQSTEQRLELLNKQQTYRDQLDALPPGDPRIPLVTDLLLDVGEQIAEQAEPIVFDVTQGQSNKLQEFRNREVELQERRKDLLDKATDMSAEQFNEADNAIEADRVALRDEMEAFGG